MWSEKMRNDCVENSIHNVAMKKKKLVASFLGDFV
jgi:hypothetical protein